MRAILVAVLVALVSSHKLVQKGPGGGMEGNENLGMEITMNGEKFKFH